MKSVVRVARYAWVLPALAMFAGCQRQNTGGGMPAGPRPAGQTASPEASATPPSIPGVPKSDAPQESRFEIPTKNWQAPAPAQGQPAPTAESIAAKADAALASLPKCFCETDIAIQGELTGQVTGRIMVRNKGEIYAEYRDPEDPGTLGSILTMAGKTWDVRGSKGASEVVEPLPDNLASQWTRLMPRAVALGASGQAKVFALAVKEFRGAGYAVKLETTQMNVGDRKVPFYRITAQASGESSPSMEMRFDGNRFLPLTLRTIGKDSKGKKLLVQWNGRWSFNRPIDETVFVAPKIP